MNSRLIRTALGCVLLIGVISAEDFSGLDIMEKVATQPNPRSSVSRIKLTLISFRRGKEKRRVREIIRYQKFYSSGKFRTKSLIQFSKPSDVKGTAFLLWRYRSGKPDDQWLFLPALGQVRRIASRERSGNFMGTDFTYEDLSGWAIGDDSYELIGEESVSEKIPCYIVRAVPESGGSSYGQRIVWVDQENWLIKKIEFYDQDKELFKVLTITHKEKSGDYWTADGMIMENILTRHRTMMEISDVKYDTGLRDDYFTERFLIRMDP